MTDSMERILHATLFTPTSKGWGLPIMYWGEPGIAKTDIIEAVCTRAGLYCETVSPAEYGEGAFGVVGVPHKDGFLHFPPPEIVKRVKQHERSVIYLDEFSCAPPALEPYLMAILLAKRWGGTKLGRGVRVIGSANPPNCAARGFRPSLPTANRMGHIDWEAPTPDDWCDWVMGAIDDTAPKPLDAGAEEARVLRAWDIPWAMVRGQVTAFIRSKSDSLHKMGEKGQSGNYAWPSMRTWEMAMRALASSEVHHLSEVDSEMFARSFVGLGVFEEFVDYRKTLDLPNPKDLLEGRINFKHNPRRLDITYAVLSSCATYTVNTKKKDYADALQDIMLDQVADKSADLCWPASKILLKGGYGVDSSMRSQKMTDKLFGIMENAKAA